MWVNEETAIFIDKFINLEKTLKSENSRLQSRIDSALDKIKCLERLCSACADVSQNNYILQQKAEKENLKLICKVFKLEGEMTAITKILKDLLKRDWEK